MGDKKILKMKLFKFLFFFIVIPVLSAQESRELVVDNPDAIVDLRSHTGVNMVSAEWRYSDATIVDDQLGAPGPSEGDPLRLYPTGPKQATWNIEPKAGSVDFDDSRCCLLYTSPSPRDQRGSRMPSSA